MSPLQQQCCKGFFISDVHRVGNACSSLVLFLQIIDGLFS